MAELNLEFKNERLACKAGRHRLADRSRISPDSGLTQPHHLLSHNVVRLITLTVKHPKMGNCTKLHPTDC